MRIQRWSAPPIMSDGLPPAFFRPRFPGQLSLVEGEAVFAIGSCFARNVEGFLIPHFRVPSRIVASGLSARDSEVHRLVSADLTYLHRYNVFSIRHSLEWALDPAAAPPGRLLDVGQGRSLDPYAGSPAVLAAVDAADLQRLLDRTMATVRECRVVIITLGLSEVWEDLQTGLVMNTAPGAPMWHAFPGRFRFRVASCADTVQELEHIHRILSRHCMPGFQVIVSVSPIPLRASFRADDIVVSNTASKAILRAAVEQWVALHDNVEYFPSYEMIINSSPSMAWDSDSRHCRIEIIRSVMRVFFEDFIKMEEASSSDDPRLQDLADQNHS